MSLRWTLFLLAALHAGAETRAIFPPGVKPVGPYSPGILAGDFLYVSGQGARHTDGQMPASFEEQATQCLENVKSRLRGAFTDHLSPAERAADVVIGLLRPSQVQPGTEAADRRD